MAAESVNFDITDLCNLACEFCRVGAGEQYIEFQFFKELVERHPDVKLVGIGGGEPLLHPEFVRIVEYLLENERIVNLSTNLWEETERLEPFYGTPADKFTVQISLPASNRDLYREITKRDAFDEVVENACKVKDGLSTMVSCSVYQRNRDDVNNLIDFVNDELGLLIKINLGYPVGRAEGLAILTHDELLALAGTITAKRVERKRVVSGIGFSDQSCTDVIVPCNYNAPCFGVNYQAGTCLHDRIFYDAYGSQRKCEFMGG